MKVSIVAALAIASGTLLLNAEDAVMEKKHSETGVVLVAFGTSHSSALSAYENIEAKTRKKLSGAPLVWAYTSGKIRKKLENEGRPVCSPSDALAEILDRGCSRILMQSLHIVPGEEFQEAQKAVSEIPDRYRGKAEIAMGRPLLSDEKDIDAFAGIVKNILPKERAPEDAVVFMGHGNSKGVCDDIYASLASKLKNADKNIFLATVEGKPDFKTLLADLEDSGVKKAFLMPFMVVAGDHAKNDLAGDDENSWKSMLEKNGIECVPVLKGLGDYGEVAELWAERIANALKPER